MKQSIRLAPLAGVTDWPFRALCFEQGCDEAYTEMVSAMGYCYAPMAQATQNLLYRAPSDKKLILQLFGKEPEWIGRAAAELSGQGIYDGIDINMGCPVHKVAAAGEGSGLLRTPNLASAVMKAAVKGSCVPVSVKIRLGWDESEKNFLEICRRAEDAGVSEIAVHGRTRQQMYAGSADWDSIYQAAEAVSIPVYGNGDIFDAADAVKRLHGGPVAGLLIARGAMGNPWLFGQIRQALEGETVQVPDTAEKMRIAMRHLDMLLSWKPERIAVREMRKHVGWYLHGVRGAAELRRQVNHIEGAEELRNLLKQTMAQGEVGET